MTIRQRFGDFKVKIGLWLRDNVAIWLKSTNFIYFEHFWSKSWLKDKKHQLLKCWLKDQKWTILIKKNSTNLKSFFEHFQYIDLEQVD